MASLNIYLLELGRVHTPYYKDSFVIDLEPATRSIL